MNSKDTFGCSVAKRVKFTEEVLASKLQGSIFRSYEPPSELCDGGDYIKEIQIRVENKKGDVYLSINPSEDGEWWSGTIS